jgi:hypothetical protein
MESPSGYCYTYRPERLKLEHYSYGETVETAVAIFPLTRQAVWITKTKRVNVIYAQRA